jgi:hypothetical protein
MHWRLSWKRFAVGQGESEKGRTMPYGYRVVFEHMSSVRCGGGVDPFSNGSVNVGYSILPVRGQPVRPSQGPKC